MKKFRKNTIVLALTFLVLLMASCSGNPGSADTAAEPSVENEQLVEEETPASAPEPAPEPEPDFSGVKVRIAQQYGMQYAPVYVMQELGLLEKHLPGAELEWSQLAGGSAMNEALIAGQLDIAFMGLPPLIIAWSKGVDYRIAAGICVPPSELMIKKEGINSIEDLTPTDKIGVPSVGSIQHIMLAMAAERVLGDANALDQNIVAMANPDAYAALISGTDIIGHMASMPYIDLETKDGCTSILTAREAYGQEASIICVTTSAFHSDSSGAYDGLMAALAEAIDLINAKGPEVISVISEIEKISEEDALAYVQWPGTIYDTRAYGAWGLAQFMFEQEYIDKAPESVSDLMWDNAVAVDK